MDMRKSDIRKIIKEEVIQLIKEQYLTEAFADPKLEIKNKNLKGEGDNTALWLNFEYIQTSPLQSLEIKNAVFTDLFFDQNNIVYIHIDEKSKSLMLDKKKSIHQLKF